MTLQLPTLVCRRTHLQKYPHLLQKYYSRLFAEVAPHICRTIRPLRFLQKYGSGRKQRCFNPRIWTENRPNAAKYTLTQFLAGETGHLTGITTSPRQLLRRFLSDAVAYIELHQAQCLYIWTCLPFLVKTCFKKSSILLKFTILRIRKFST
jgi:hypothetical protein